MSTCELCNVKREKCFQCGSGSSSYCIDCNNKTDSIYKYRRINKHIICDTCYINMKCTSDNCCNLKLLNCSKCFYNYSFDKCKDHSEVLSLCDKCISNSKCQTCLETKINTWTHPCGTFCVDCCPKITINISPLTLAKLFNKNGVFKCNARYLLKCTNCMEGKTILEWQREEYNNI